MIHDFRLWDIFGGGIITTGEKACSVMFVKCKMLETHVSLDRDHLYEDYHKPRVQLILHCLHALSNQSEARRTAFKYGERPNVDLGNM